MNLLFIVSILATLLFSSQAWAIEQIIPPDRLGKIKASLPEVASPKVQAILDSSETLWYDSESMAKSYQDSIGASSNDKWPDLVAASAQVIDGLYDRVKRRWHFPFGSVAGTDDSTNIKTVNFVSFPRQQGHIKVIPITQVRRNDQRPHWTWRYHPETVFGEVIFLRDGHDLLPAELRIRTKYERGWTANAFRPFPHAQDLRARIQQLRMDWSISPKLLEIIDHLQDNSTLQARSLAGQGRLASVFSEDGHLDQLPHFDDTDLVRDLLRTTKFSSVFGRHWKRDGSKTSFAPTTTEGLSIVPNHYLAGLIPVNDASCMRCHQEAGRLVSDYFGQLYLYGEMWGQDGIFSFHPYDESFFPYLRRAGSGPGGFADNRRLNPKLKEIFRLSP